MNGQTNNKTLRQKHRQTGEAHKNHLERHIIKTRKTDKSLEHALNEFLILMEDTLNFSEPCLSEELIGNHQSRGLLTFPWTSGNQGVCSENTLK